MKYGTPLKCNVSLTANLFGFSSFPHFVRTLAIFIASVLALGSMMFTVPEHGSAETYMMQGTELNPQYSTVLYDHVGTVKNDGTPEVVDPGLYYPAASNYGYYHTGVELPAGWEDHQKAFSLDGTDVQYMGTQSESLPYLYLTPSYGYGESPYNPYNPYIPGAVTGLDNTYVATQPYYTVQTYQTSASSPGYYPAVQQYTDAYGSSSMDSWKDVPSAVNKGMSTGGKHKSASASVAFSQNHSKPASNQTQSVLRLSDGSRINSGTNNRPIAQRATASRGVSHGAQPIALPQGGTGTFNHRMTDNFSHGKVLSQHNQWKVSVPVGGSMPNFASGTNGRTSVDGSWPKYYSRRPFADVNGIPELVGEQNRGPRTNRSKNQLFVKAYTTKAGDVTAEGNIVISADEYNKDDLPVDYAHAKFFVIKSYSEDDVHKSIKYNIWSSTPNGNKKLSSAYEDAQRIAAENQGGCPIFLFFSVNASGQFCGVAEMVGAVDFLKDMDFWQQDKWTGSFRVKWHIIKDVPNPNFRHIILENNEHKPVTNSRDTQEIMYRPGMEMLKIFKSYTPRTSLLDDFMYYEQRQQIMYEERSQRPEFNSFPFRPSRKLDPPIDLPIKDGGNITKAMSSSGQPTESSTEHFHSTGEGDKQIAMVPKNNGTEDIDISTLMIGSLTINTEPKSAGMASSSVTGSTDPADIVTVGSVPLKVNGFHKSSGLVTVGTIPLDTRAVQPSKTSLLSKESSME
ncbi:hypothetical protein Droror1_Dr00002532 [Drosera rotundifolia]